MTSFVVACGKKIMRMRPLNSFHHEGTLSISGYALPFITILDHKWSYDIIVSVLSVVRQKKILFGWIWTDLLFFIFHRVSLAGFKVDLNISTLESSSWGFDGPLGPVKIKLVTICVFDYMEAVVYWTFRKCINNQLNQKWIQHFYVIGRKELFYNHLFYFCSTLISQITHQVVVIAPTSYDHC